MADTKDSAPQSVKAQGNAKELPNAISDTPDDRSRRTRGKGVIYLGLREAEEAIKKIDQRAKQMTKTGFARALGHDGPQGRFVQKLEALEQFNLVELNDDDVKLTALSEDMLYSGSEAARNKARVTAFLAYDDFRRTFAECPKNQDHPLSYVREFASGKLGIINEVDKFLRLFLESAYFAGLLDGEPNSKAEKIRFRQAPVGEAKPSDGSSASAKAETAEFEALPIEDEEAVLASLGLLAFRGQANLERMATGRVKLQTSTDSIMIEVDRPFRIVVRTTDVLSDVVQIVNCLKEKGYRA
jgi:hypothetical protein